MTGASPFATWVMSHVLADVVSCHGYDLRIIRHLQQPRQDPIEERQRKEKQRRSNGEVCLHQKEKKVMCSENYTVVRDSWAKTFRTKDS